MAFGEKKSRFKKGVFMIDYRNKNDLIFNEFDNESIMYWFDFKKKKFLHNIDTFYYSVKFKNNFLKDSKDQNVKKFRNFFKKYKDDCTQFGSVPFYLLGFDSALDYKNMSFGKYYNIWLSKNDFFDIIFASTVPPKEKDSNDSVTPECIVQIRSYILWLYGVNKAFEMSFEYVRTIADYFGLEIDYTLENRCDFAFHSNYLTNPEKFFSPDNFTRMQVSRFRGANLHISFNGKADYDIDYVALGKRSDKVFVRCYLKSKEVVEMGYKSFFFKLWFFNGLINRYDLYVYEKAFLKRKWDYIHYARLEYYLEFGKNEHYKDTIRHILNGDITYTIDEIKRLADIFTPKINLITNVEFQVMRKHSKSYMLIPFNLNNTGVNARIYDFLDNRPLIIDYLTTHVLRLTAFRPDIDDINHKSRSPDCAFWRCLKNVKLVDCNVKSKDLWLVREYDSKLNAEIVKKDLLRKTITYSAYHNTGNSNNLYEDMVVAICSLNDNDIKFAERYKMKKLRELSQKELPKLNYDTSNFAILNKVDGSLYE